VTKTEQDARFVDIPTALGARGLRLIVVGAVPSPWSEAAKAILRVKGLDAMLVRFRIRDPDLMLATGTHNAPVALFDDEPPRTGWAEILALAERLGGRCALVPAAATDRVRLYGLGHEICGENGLGWCTRLLIIHHSLTTAGARGLAPRIAGYLARKYGYDPGVVPAARARILALFQSLEHELAAGGSAGGSTGGSAGAERVARPGPYFFGTALTAVDLYAATFLTSFVGLGAEDTALGPDVASIFDGLIADLGAAVPASLLAHRRLVFREHLPGPIVF